MATTWNPSDKSTNITLSGSNLVATCTADLWSGVRGTVAKSTGKWYWEWTAGTTVDDMVGLMTAGTTLDGTNYANPSTAYIWYSTSGGFYRSGALVFATANWGSGDKIGYAYDADAGKIWGSLNGTWANSGDPAAGTGYIWTGAPSGLYPMFGTDKINDSVTVNFSATTTYTPPTGFSVFDASAAVAVAPSLLTLGVG